MNKESNYTFHSFFLDQEVPEDTDILLYCIHDNIRTEYKLYSVYIEDLKSRIKRNINFGEVIVAEYKLEYDSTSKGAFKSLKYDSNKRYSKSFQKDRWDRYSFTDELDSSTFPAPKIGEKALWGFSGNEELGIKEFYQKFTTRKAPYMILDSSKIIRDHLINISEDFVLRWKPYNPNDSIIIGINNLNIWKKIPDTGEFVFKKELFERQGISSNEIMFLLKIDKKINYKDDRKIVFLSFSETSYWFDVADWKMKK